MNQTAKKVNQTAESLIAQGNQLRKENRLEEATIFYRRAIELEPNSYQSYHFLGEALVEKDDLDAAANSYRCALEINPKFYWSYHCLGLVLFWQGKLDEAISASSQAIQLNPNIAAFQNQLGQALAKKGELYNAVNAYKAAIKIDPNKFQFHQNLAKVLAKLEHLSETNNDSSKIDDNFSTSEHRSERVVAIFQRLKASKLLQKLRDKKNLIFVGEEETISHLKFLLEPSKQSGNYYYYCWDKIYKKNRLIDSKEFSNFQGVIVVSTNNEHAIFEGVQEYVLALKLDIPVLKLFSDIFVNVMSKQELLQKSDCNIKSSKLSYAIIANPRSGSYFLCNALKTTEIAGFPTEHLQESSLALAQHCHFDYVRYLRILMTHQGTENGVFGTKFISHYLRDHLNTSWDFNLTDHFSKFIYLVRRDRVAQAVSYYLAAKTNVWMIRDEKHHHKYSQKINQRYFDDSDLEEVHRLYGLLTEQELYLKKFFEQNNISPLVIEYEKLSEDLEGNIYKILTYLNIADDASKSDIYFRLKQLPDKKLRSDLSDNIIQKYKENYFT